MPSESTTSFPQKTTLPESPSDWRVFLMVHGASISAHAELYWLLEPHRRSKRFIRAMSRKFKILFVCGGNTCRSPMAVGVATTRLAGRAEVSSAGVEACGQQASTKAKALMLRRYQFDLSPHRSTDVDNVQLGDFDFIVAMEPKFAKRLAEEFKVPLERIITWNIEDPAIENTDAAYELCLSVIEKLVPQVLDLMLPGRRES